MNDRWADDELTVDDFLGGQLKIAQPKRGYRAGIDPVILAACVEARPGDEVLDLGCGAGVAGLCLARRVPGIGLTGLEIQPDYAALARRNAQANDIKIDVIVGDLANPPDEIKARQFHHVIANPPYFDRNTSSAAGDSGRETALGEKTPLSAWIETAAKRTRPKGYVTIIHRAERLPELLHYAGQYLGSLEVLPLIPRRGKPARLILLRGRRDGKSGFRLHDGWVLHSGDEHDGDRENYTIATACILRTGAQLPFGT